MPVLEKSKAQGLVRRRHPEWTHHEVHWRWLRDSLEAGKQYREAEYPGPNGERRKNLVRHNRENPVPGQPNQSLAVGQQGAGTSNAYTQFENAAQSTYWTRLERTPVPNWVSEAIEKYLSRIFGRKVSREDGGLPGLSDFWADVDGRGTPIDEWICEAAGPLLLALGQLDVFMAAPPIPQGAVVQSMADVQALGLDRPRVGYILPENMLWWRHDDLDRYRECLVLEFGEDDEGKPVERYRHWSEVDSVVYDKDGNVVAGPFPNPGGVIPIRRIFDARKHSCRWVGRSRMEAVAEAQRDYYNRDSELVLNDIQQSCAPLSGPVEMFGKDSGITVGPGWVLPKFPGPDNKVIEWSYVEPPKGVDESIRTNLDRRRDEADRATCQTKPAGATTSGTVAQSGISKEFDQEDGNNRLKRICQTLARMERALVEMLIPLRTGKSTPVPDSVKIGYPKGFALRSASEQMALIQQWQVVLMGAGRIPEIDEYLLKRAIRDVLAGCDDEEFVEIDAAIDAYVKAHRELADQTAEGDDPLARIDPVGRARQKAAQSEQPGAQVGKPGDKTED